MHILHRHPAALGLAVAFWTMAPPAQAQGTNGREAKVWRLEQLDKGFCIQFLVDPAAAARKLPRRTSPLRAGRLADLPPALRSVVQAQPEFANWTPSQLCLFYLRAVDADGNRLEEDEDEKLPLLGFWTVAAADSFSGRRRDLALEVLTSNGRLERWGRDVGLRLEKVRSKVSPVPPDADGVPSGLDRHVIRIDGTELVWDGRSGVDSAPPKAPLVRDWTAEGRHGGWVTGTLTVTADWTRAMVGSLKVQGKDELARLLKASPIRFVGPAYQGGGGSIEFDR